MPNVNLSTYAPSIYRIELTAADGTVIDLRKFFLGCNVYTNIFYSFLEMEMIVNDPVDFVKMYKIKGYEKLNFEFMGPSVKSKPISLELRLVSVEGNDIKNSEEKKNELLMRFKSKEALDSNYTFCRSLSGTGNSIMSKLFSDVLGSTRTLDSDTMTDSYTLVGNGMTINKFIDYVAKQDAALFYEDLGGLHYKKFFNMLKSPTAEYLKFGGNARNDKTELSNVNRYTHSKIFDLEDAAKDGIWGSQLTSMPATTNKVASAAYNYSEFNSLITSKLGDNKFGTGLILPTGISGKSSIEAKYGNVANRIQRVMLYNLLDNHTVAININGDSERRIGTVVDLNFEGRGQAGELHPMYNGRWFVTAIRHEITHGTYLQDLQLSKIQFFS